MTDRPTDPNDPTDATEPKDPTDATEPNDPTQATEANDATATARFDALPADVSRDPASSQMTALTPPPTPEPGAATAELPPSTPPAPPSAPASPPPPSLPWPPPSWRRGSDEPGRLGTIILGVILLAIGLWFFADQTLGFDMPNLRWSQLWPILLIGLGAWVAFGAMRNR